MLMLLAVMLALAPEPSLGPGDDFNEVVALNEKQLHCEAVKLYRSTDQDTMRLVVFSCGHGELIVPFIYQGKEGWFPI